MLYMDDHISVRSVLYLKFVFRENQMILCGDIGGTKTQLCLVHDLDHYRPTQGVCYQNVHFASIEALLDCYLETCQVNVHSACLSIAGLVRDGSCQMTNLPWYLCEERLVEHLKLDCAVLINDLTATAFAVPHLPDSDFHVLQGGLPIFQDGPIGVVSIGTGLGESVLVWDKDYQRYTALESEGGHKDFAPHSVSEIELYRYLLAKLDVGRLSAERLVSGQGLVLIYDYLANNVTSDQEKLSADLLTPEQISEQAKDSPDSLSAQAVALFVNIIAAEVANVALQYLSSGGIVIAGGVLPKILHLFSVEQFLLQFHDKGRFGDWLEGIPVVVCKNIAAPSIGAFHFLKESQGN